MVEGEYARASEFASFAIATGAHHRPDVARAQRRDRGGGVRLQLVAEEQQAEELEVLLDVRPRRVGQLLDLKE